MICMRLFGINSGTYLKLCLFNFSDPLISAGSFFHCDIERCLTKTIFFLHDRMEVTVEKASRSLSKEVVTALLSSVTLGFGSLFLLLWVGIYV